ncbi:MAG: TatD family hydrolase [Oscillospiraceae bacterium]
MLNNIFDSHAHYDDERFDADRDTLLTSLFENGVSGIVHASTDIKSAEFGVEYSERFPLFYTSAGVHPENLNGLDENYISRLEELSRAAKVAAIGEIGLDYYWEKENKELQKKVFSEQLELANRLGLPVIVHLREATQDGLELLTKYRPKGVVHCFSGSVETAREVLSLGMYIGFTGVITFPKSFKAQEVLKIVPDDRLLLETDCPYMAPVPNRGKRCDSGMIADTAKKAAEIKGMEVQEILNITAGNARRMYGLEVRG